MYIAIVKVRTIYEDTEINAKYYLCHKKLDKLYDDIVCLRSRLSKFTFYKIGSASYVIRFVSFDRMQPVDQGVSIEEI